MVVPDFVKPSNYRAPVFQRFGEQRDDCIDCEFAFGAGKWANYDCIDLFGQRQLFDVRLVQFV